MPRFTRPYSRSIKKRSRTLPIFGKGDDDSRYFRCWHCGFVCKVDRDELGDEESEAGDDHADINNLANADSYTNNAANHSSIRMCLGHYVAMRIGADGNPKTIVHLHTSDVSRGCPFCGSTNWRGDY